MLLVPKAGLEPARISTVDFESTASTDFATSALKRYAENVEDYTVTQGARNPNPPRCDLSAEKSSATLLRTASRPETFAQTGYHAINNLSG